MQKFVDHGLLVDEITPINQQVTKLIKDLLEDLNRKSLEQWEWTRFIQKNLNEQITEEDTILMKQHSEKCESEASFSRRNSSAHSGETRQSSNHSSEKTMVDETESQPKRCKTEKTADLEQGKTRIENGVKIETGDNMEDTFQSSVQEDTSQTQASENEAETEKNLEDFRTPVSRNSQISQSSTSNNPPNSQMQTDELDHMATLNPDGRMTSSTVNTNTAAEVSTIQDTVASLDEMSDQLDTGSNWPDPESDVELNNGVPLNYVNSNSVDTMNGFKTSSPKLEENSNSRHGLNSTSRIRGVEENVRIINGASQGPIKKVPAPVMKKPATIQENLGGSSSRSKNVTTGAGFNTISSNLNSQDNKSKGEGKNWEQTIDDDLARLEKLKKQ